MSWHESTLGDECELYQPQTLAKKELDNSGIYKVYGANGVIGTHSKFNHESPQLLVTCRGATCGTINISEAKSWINGNAMVIKPRNANIDLYFLSHYLHTLDISKAITGAAQPQITRQSLAPIKIKFPPLEEQQRISEVLDKAASVKEKREQAIAKLDEIAQSTYLEMFSNCNEKVSIKDVILRDRIADHSDGNSVWSLTLEQIESQSGNLIKKIMVDRKELGSSTFYFQSPVVLYSKLRPYLNKVIIPKESGYATTELVPLYPSDKVLPIYLATVLRSKRFVEYADVNSAGAKMPRVIMDKFWDYQIPVPSITKQKIFSDICDSIENQKINHLNSYSKIQLLIESLQDHAFSAGVND